VNPVGNLGAASAAVRREHIPVVVERQFSLAADAPRGVRRRETRTMAQSKIMVSSVANNDKNR
jgi:hypothetical protein